jgi:hypothetical protein
MGSIPGVSTLFRILRILPNASSASPVLRPALSNFTAASVQDLSIPGASTKEALFCNAIAIGPLSAAETIRGARARPPAPVGTQTHLARDLQPPVIVNTDVRDETIARRGYQ